MNWVFFYLHVRKVNVRLYQPCNRQNLICLLHDKTTQNIHRIKCIEIDGVFTCLSFQPLKLHHTFLTNKNDNISEAQEVR